MENINVFNFLKTVPLFDSISENFFKTTFVNNFEIKTFQKSEIIFTEGNVCDHLSLIISGNVELQKIEYSGKILSIAHLSQKDFFGENLLYGTFNTFPLTVYSKTTSKILFLHKNLVLSLCQSDIVFLDKFLKLLSNKARNLYNVIKNTTIKTIREKITMYLYTQYTSQNSNYLVIKPNRNELSEILGIERPSLSRELMNLKNEGLIDYKKNTFKIINPNLLFIDLI